MNSWPHPLVTCTREEVQKFCVQDSLWQAYRLKMKGTRTTSKLSMLNAWYIREVDHGAFEGDSQLKRRAEVQISNYINALKRGGQLNDDLTIRRN